MQQINQHLFSRTLRIYSWNVPSKRINKYETNPRNFAAFYFCRAPTHGPAKNIAEKPRPIETSHCYLGKKSHFQRKL